jgi:hypothetical protein
VLAALWLALPSPAWSWGGATHHYIAQHYSQHLPAEIDGLRAYDAVVDQKVTDPDSRKSYTPGEGPRHYLDIDAYPEFFTGTLPHDRAALEALYGTAIVLSNGVLPWAVGEVVDTLAQRFQTGRWSDAATAIADLCHYVGDASQPLHCTQNYDGQLSGNDGIHSRYESGMMSNRIALLHTPAMTATVHPDAVDAMFELITASWAGVGTILQADEAARAASGGAFDATYYAALWAGTESMTRVRIDSATVVTASFVRTAWQQAGRPRVPGSSAGVGPPALAGAGLQVWPTPFRGELAVRFAAQVPVRVEVFDLRGARVATLSAEGAGSGTVSWRPAASGARVTPGLYFVRLHGPGVDVVRRVTLLE